MITGTLYVIAGVIWMIGSIWWFRVPSIPVGLLYMIAGIGHIGLGVYYLNLQ